MMRSGMMHRFLVGLRRLARQMYFSVLLSRTNGPFRLHLGCGRRRISGFVNIDLNHSAATDYVTDISSLPCRSGTAERIEAYHVIEHIPHPQVPAVLREWRRVLRPDGVLVLECPDFEAVVRELQAGNRERMFSIFGRQRFPGDVHHWGYSAESLTASLREAGFSRVESRPPQDYHVAQEPCLRVEARPAA